MLQVCGSVIVQLDARAASRNACLDDEVYVRTRPGNGDDGDDSGDVLDRERCDPLSRSALGNAAGRDGRG